MRLSNQRAGPKPATPELNAISKYFLALLLCTGTCYLAATPQECVPSQQEASRLSATGTMASFSADALAMPVRAIQQEAAEIEETEEERSSLRRYLDQSTGMVVVQILARRLPEPLQASRQLVQPFCISQPLPILLGVLRL